MKILEKIENEIVVARIPDIIFDAIVGPSHFEFNNDRNLILRFLITFLHEIDKLLSVFV